MPNDGENILLVSMVHRVYSRGYLFDEYSSTNNNDNDSEWVMKRYTDDNDITDLESMLKKYRVNNDIKLDWILKQYRVDNVYESLYRNTINAAPRMIVLLFLSAYRVILFQEEITTKDQSKNCNDDGSY